MGQVARYSENNKINIDRICSEIARVVKSIDVY